MTPRQPAFTVFLTGKLPLFFFVCFLASTPTFNQSFKLQEYNQEDGLIDDRIYTLLMDENRRLWIGTAGGLSIFDGENFYPPPFGTDSLLTFNEPITGLSDDPENNVWISTQKGIWKFDLQYGTVKKMYTPERAEGWITRIVWSESTPFGWFITPKKLCKINRADLSVEGYTLHTANSIFYSLNPLVEDKDGLIWFTSGYNFWHFDPETQQLQEHPIVARDDPEVWSVYKSSDQQIWLGTRSHGLFLLDDQKQVQPVGLPGQYIRTLFGNSEKLWAGGGKDGLLTIHLKNKEVKNWTTPQNYSNDWANAFLEDTVQEILWVGTQKGLLKIDNKKELIQTTELPISNTGYPPYFLNFREDISNPEILWIKIIDQGIGKWESKTGNFKLYNPDTPFGKSNNNFIQVRSGQLWCTTYADPGIRIFDPKEEKWTSPDWSETWPDVSWIYEDRDGQVWIGTEQGKLGYGNRTTITEIPEVNQLIKDSIVAGIFTIDESPSGFIWTHTDHQIFRINKATKSLQEIRILTLSETQQPEFLTLMADHANTIWVGAREGLWQIDGDGNVLRMFLNEGPEKLGFVYRIQQDPLGMIWLGTNNGVFRINPGNGHVRKISSQDGLLSDQAFFISTQSSGRLYIGYPSAFQNLDTRIFDIDTFAPPLQIMDFKIMDRSILTLPGKEIIIRPSENYFTIYYAAMNYRQSELNRYKYRLQGYEEKWHHVDGNNLASYSNIPAGKYTFELQGSNNDGLWTPVQAMVPIKVLAPFYKQSWFKLLVFFISGMLVAFYFYLRKAEQVKIKKLRLQIARDLHDEIGSSLSSIGFLTEFVRHQNKSDASESDAVLQKIGQTTGHISDAMAGIIWTLQEEQPQFSHIIQRLDSFGKRLAHSQGLEFEVVVDPAIHELTIPLTSLKDIYLIGKEGLHNAAKYAGKCKMTIEFQNLNNRLHLRISDNGVGCDLGKVRKGNGLKNIMERVSEIGGYYELESQEGEGFRIDVYL